MCDLARGWWNVRGINNWLFHLCCCQLSTAVFIWGFSGNRRRWSRQIRSGGRGRRWEANLLLGKSRIDYKHPAADGQGCLCDVCWHDNLRKWEHGLGNDPSREEQNNFCRCYVYGNQIFSRSNTSFDHTLLQESQLKHKQEIKGSRNQFVLIWNMSQLTEEARRDASKGVMYTSCLMQPHRGARRQFLQSTSMCLQRIWAES